jgi:hypothetical protein
MTRKPIVLVLAAVILVADAAAAAAAAAATAHAPLPASNAQDKAAILRLRAANNRAIAARDLNGTMRM